MNLLLSIGLAAILLLAVLATLVVLWYKYVIKRNYCYHLAASINRFPGRLRLKKQDPVAWQKAERAQQRVDEFKAAGFVELGGFLIEELPNARMLALRHAENGVVGVVNETTELGTWSDVYLFPVLEKQPILASSILKPGLLYFLAGDPKFHKPDASVLDLVKTAQVAAGAGSTIRSVTAENFAALFETAFAEATDARLLTTPDDGELRKLLKERDGLCGGEISAKDFEGVKVMLPLALQNELRLACGSQFLRETTMPASEWQHATQRLLVVHDRTPIRRLAGKLIFGAFLTGEMRNRLRQVKAPGNPRSEFAGFNEKLPAWVRYKKLGEVTHPIAADIFRAPIERGKS